MLKSQSPHILVSICALLCSIIVLTCVYISLHLPWLGLRIEFSDTQNTWLLTSVDPKSPNHDAINTYLQQKQLQLPVTINAFQAHNNTIPLNSALFIEEPDSLPSYEEFNQLMQQQHALFAASHNNELRLVASDNDMIALKTVNRSLSNLTALFWFQLFVGVGGALTGALVWASRRRDMAAALYALTGLGYLIFAPAAAIYSTRELIIDGELFRWLSALNHVGALFFTASLTSLLWTYPIRLGTIKLPLVLYGLALLALTTNILQLADPAIMHLSVLLIFSISFIFAFIQWRKTRNDPRGRAALRWFLLSIYTATGLFAGFIIIPAALQIQQLAPQGIMFGAFLIMYWGLALGIVKYRLFQLEQWWHSITGWFISGLFIVVFDIVLVSFLALPQAMALPIALAIAGWIYFPLRQFLWNKIGKQRSQHINTWIGSVLPLLIDRQASETFKSSNERWPEILRAVWRSPQIEQCRGALEKPSITNDGISLLVPAYDTSQDFHFCISLPDFGARLFTTADFKTLHHVQQIVGLALERIEARNQGIQTERDRIRRDMHDDLGATLLKIFHASDDKTKPLVRNAIVDMRRLVSTLDNKPLGKYEAIANWRKEIEERCQIANADLAWADHEETLPEYLAARTYANLSRILREAVSNALKYSEPAAINVSFTQNTIRITNIAAESQVQNGYGQRIMTERAAEINAVLRQGKEGSVYFVNVTIPPEQG